MSEDMNLSVNGQSQVPPGFRFHPTEEELLHYYLRKKVAYQKIDLDVIREVDLNKLEPWDIQEKCKIGSGPQNDWYFFSHKDKKYPTGTRTNRATAAGFWKATGRDKVIYSSFKRIGMRKTLVFYMGRAPHGQKSDWIMHEYRLDELSTQNTTASNTLGADSIPEDGWVICRVFRKKNYQKSLESPKSSSASIHSRTQVLNSSNDGVLDQILVYMGRNCKQENETTSNMMNISNNDDNNMHGFLNVDQSSLHQRFLHLPRLESPTLPNYQSIDEMYSELPEPSSGCNTSPLGECEYSKVSGLNDWVSFDRLVASQLNGQVDTSRQLSSFSHDPNLAFCISPEHDDVQEFPQQLRPNCSNRGNNQSSQVYGSEIDLWSSFTRSLSSSSADPLCHLSV